MMGRLLGSWREYDIGQSGYKILAFVSGKDVDIAAASDVGCSCRRSNYTNFYSGTQ